jgi:hypothetical protein
MREIEQQLFNVMVNSEGLWIQLLSLMIATRSEESLSRVQSSAAKCQ